MVDPDFSPRDARLLDELQAIRDLLNDRDNAGVPLLRDVVKAGAVPLLDLNEIFEELAATHSQPELDEIQTQAAEFAEAQQLPEPAEEVFGSDDTEPPADHTAIASAAESRPLRDDWRRDLLIQEVVDDFIPHVEAALRERLRRVDSETLRRWLDE